MADEKKKDPKKKLRPSEEWIARRGEVVVSLGDLVIDGETRVCLALRLVKAPPKSINVGNYWVLIPAGMVGPSIMRPEMVVKEWRDRFLQTKKEETT